MATGDAAYLEVTRERRTSGNCFRYQPPWGGAVMNTGRPFCMRGHTPFDEPEVAAAISHWSNQHMGLGDASRLTISALNLDRGCGSWRAYQPGLNPSKSVELVVLEASEKATRDLIHALDKVRSAQELKGQRSQKIGLWVGAGIGIGGLIAGFLGLII